MPRGPVIVTCVGEGVMVTEGGNLIGSRPMMETFLDSTAVELNWRASLGIDVRMFMTVVEKVWSCRVFAELSRRSGLPSRREHGKIWRLYTITFEA